MSSGYYLTPAFYYLNLGAHMIYILRNRLEAQNIRKEKIVRILQDINNAVFKQHFVTNLLLPQDPFTVNTLKDLFSRLAHSSIMKLDQTSMDKMFYLMLLSVKKEIYLTSSPLELYTLTLSHLLNIAKCLEGADGSATIEYAIQQFQKSASKYSFIQYLEIREYMLSELEKYQTKIVNFIESGYQNNSGRMIFRVRNSHNQKSIGSAVNQTDQDCAYTQVKPQNQLFYNDWLTWKSSLVIDFVEDYKKSSQRRNNKVAASIPSPLSSKAIEQKQKGLGDILNLRFDDIENFQVKFDILGGEDDANYSKDQEFQESLKSTTKTSKPGQASKTSNSYKTQIQKQFADLKFEKGEQEEDGPDLLDMMDN